MTANDYSIGRRINDAITMFVVLFVSLLLLIYVAYGEAKRTYEGFQGDKLFGQLLVVQNSMQTPLRSGLQLKQFVGFKTLTDPIFSSDPTVGTLIVYDPSGTIVFSAGDSSIIQSLPSPQPFSEEKVNATASWSSAKAAAGQQDNRKKYELMNADGQYRIVVPLRNKFETVGYLGITMSESVVVDRVGESFEPLFYASLAPALLFALIIAIFGPSMAASRVPWAQISFGIVFLTASAGVIATLIALYSDGAQAKARALAGSLGQRLSDVVAFNININEIKGLDRTFGEYLKLNPDISAATLTVDGRVVIHTDKSRVGEVWERSEDPYEYVVDLTSKSSGRDVQVAVELPGGVVLEQIARSVKNFAALFIASAFLASLFFQLGGAVRRPIANERGYTAATKNGSGPAIGEWMLDHLKPVFFLGVLLEHLTYAFLPQFVQEAVLTAGVSASYASAPFVGFYLLFAVTLIPAGYMAQRIGPKPLMSVGLLLAGAGLLSLAFYPDFWTILAARCLSGVGQGMLFIGVQSYLLAVAPPGKKTQAAGIIVYGFQGGMISGMAVGSLLVGYMGPDGVFLLAAAIGLLASLYAVFAVPTISVEALAQSSSVPSRGLMVSVGQAIRNFNFMNTMVTIGVPAKAVLTGVMTFALPLLLAQSGYPQEDIGQIIMIYAISVVLSSGLISSHVDHIGSARNVLFQGALLSGIGLALIGTSGSLDPVQSASYVPTALLVIGVALLGIAHGFINAPVVTYIADSKLAEQIGQSTATATYRFLERVGHVAGPVLVGQLLIFTDFNWSAIGLVGLAIVGFGIIFILTSDPDRPQRQTSHRVADDKVVDRIAPGHRTADA
ncbi:MAG: MFS transporter [Hyphomicrobiaceae bacterium]